jgi:hypothetical protein
MTSTTDTSPSCCSGRCSGMQPRCVFAPSQGCPTGCPALPCPALPCGTALGHAGAALVVTATLSELVKFSTVFHARLRPDHTGHDNCMAICRPPPAAAHWTSWPPAAWGCCTCLRRWGTSGASRRCCWRGRRWTCGTRRAARRCTGPPPAATRCAGAAVFLPHVLLVV